jgi:hypothetical protein
VVDRAARPEVLAGLDDAEPFGAAAEPRLAVPVTRAAAARLELAREREGDGDGGDHP